MARIVVVGGGITGLATGAMLARDGHDVTVLERNPAPPPADAGEAWDGWDRPGVNQFRMLHLFAARWARVVELELPGVVDRLLDAGCLKLDLVGRLPEAVTGGSRPGDERFVQLTGRRPVVEAAVAAEADATPGLVVRRGVGVAGLATAGDAAVPRVTGVRLESGEVLDADLVVDCSGRRSGLPSWLGDVGARPPGEEVDDSGFVYYGRYFRSPDGEVPPALGGFLQHYDSVSILTLPADNGTWGVGVVASSRDAAARSLRDPDVWTRVVGAYPLVAHWLAGEPLDDAPAIMAKIEDRIRSLVVDGSPCATGVVAVADSWACTNPSVGRGASIGIVHAQALRDQLRKLDPTDHEAFALAFHDATLATVEPWYRATLQGDRHRLGEIEAQIDGRPYETDDPGYELAHALQNGMTKDPELLRAFIRIANVLDLPAEVFAEPGILERAIEHGSGWRDEPLPGPSRPELLGLLARS